MSSVRSIGPEGLVALLEGGLDRVLLIDSRPFVEYNTCHILEAVNVNCSKLMKRRLQQDKIQITELLQHSAKRKEDFLLKCQQAVLLTPATGRHLELQGQEVVVYDQSSADSASLSSEAFLSILLAKLEKRFPSVHLLSGLDNNVNSERGFAEFSHLFPGLCEGKSTLVPSCISQPSLPITSVGPTRILPHLYLGCQRDVLNKELMQQNDIAYVLNASNTCPKPDFISEWHFLRVPVNDSFCEKILPWLDRSVDFIEKAKASDGRVLVHCLAGISRSATIAIAYIMKRMNMTLDEAYRFVKEKRPTISPNFNFLGQLLDFEKKLKCVSEAPIKPRAVLQVDRSEDLKSEVSGSQESLSEQHLMTRGMCGLQLAEENTRPKRSFSLDIKSYAESGASPPSAHPDGPELSQPLASKDSASKPCQFSPMQEVSEHSPPAKPQTASVNHSPAASPCRQALHRSGSMEETPSGVLSGSGPVRLKEWHSDILLAPVASGWYLSSDSARFYSTSAIFGCGQDPESVRRRGRQRGGDCGDSRRSWHEESSFEKQLKRRSCQMEFGDGMSETHSREDITHMASRSSFSGSMEIIEVS
ncbi:Dual specificity protein phosphatase 16 [Triplophysa tibetana]|uniref:Dual specificity protein phosphatase 16 n=1 Tax=Triplophysa tibetana TaxID=1572043 RepID=A0A5A9PFJ1_9TELE|nr:Dual specificity protein phosphatase 16 [Triplophysa tibetana]